MQGNVVGGQAYHWQNHSRGAWKTLSDRPSRASTWLGLLDDSLSLGIRWLFTILYTFKIGQGMTVSRHCSPLPLTSRSLPPASPPWPGCAPQLYYIYCINTWIYIHTYIIQIIHYHILYITYYKSCYFSCPHSVPWMIPANIHKLTSS